MDTLAQLLKFIQDSESMFIGLHTIEYKREWIFRNHAENIKELLDVTDMVLVWTPAEDLGAYMKALAVLKSDVTSAINF